MNLKTIIPLIFLLLSSCSPATLDELRLEADAEMRYLTEDLKKIESKEDVLKASKQLKKHFNRIAELLIASRAYDLSDLEKMAGGKEGDSLFNELARLYEVPGVREAIESTQSEAIRMLDRSSQKSIALKSQERL